MLKRCCRYLALFISSLIDWVLGFFQLLYGIWHLSRLRKPRVTFFGSSKNLQNGLLKEAEKLANILNQKGVSIITGGGSGIMNAANCSAQSSPHEAKSVGIYTEIEDEPPNTCMDIGIKINSLTVRAWMLMKYSEAYIFFPGGFGTLHEFTQLITLISIKQLPVKPIILVGRSFWEPIVKLLDKIDSEGYIAIPIQTKLYKIYDDFHEIECMILKNCDINPD